MQFAHTLVLVTVLSVTPAALSAQADSLARARAVAALRPGQQLRLLTAGVTRTGPLSGSTHGSLEIRTEAGHLRVAIADIERLWVRGRATKTGAIVGGTAGLVAGVALGLLISEVLCDNTDCMTTAAETVIPLGAIGGAGGALAGAGIGSLIPRWRLRF